MKHIITTIIFLTSTLLAFSQIVEKDIEVSRINSLDLSSGFDVELTYSKNPSVRIEIDEELLPYLIAEVKGSTLVLGIETRNIQSLFSRTKRLTRKAYISMPTLNRIEVSSAANLFSSDVFKVDEINIDASSASTISLILQGNEADIDISSASEVKFNLDFNEISIDASSAATAILTGEAKDLDVEISSASKANIKGDFANVEVEASSASNVELNGEGKNLNVYASSASQVNALSFPVDNIVADGSSGSSMSLNPLKKINIEVNKSARYRVKKNPNLTTNISGGNVTWL